MSGAIAHTNLVLVALTLSRFGWAVDIAPQFPPDGVVRGDRTVQILVPGAGMSIYGRNLGPAAGCVGRGDPKQVETPNPRAGAPVFADGSIYPRELCDVRVLIDAEPVGLLYVSEKQINFKVPQESPQSGTVELRVVYRGQSSAPLEMKAGFEQITISLDEPAHTDMPVWIKVGLPFEFTGLVRYPFALGPAGFGCNEVEVRRNGQPLPLLPGANWIRFAMVMPGNICGSHIQASSAVKKDRLPLHLLYRFDTPGTYEVRFARRQRPMDMTQPGEIRVQSAWTPIEILPRKPNQRADWLNELRARVPSAPADLLSDVLPSVLGLPDDASLEVVLGSLYNSDAAVRQYALNGLLYWPDELTTRRLQDLLQSRGPNDDILRFLSRQAALRAASAK